MTSFSMLPRRLFDFAIRVTRIRSVEDERFFLFGRMWTDHQDIETWIRDQDGTVVGVVEPGVFLVLGDDVLLGPQEDGSYIVAASDEVTDRITKWIEFGAVPMALDGLRDALQREPQTVMARWRDARFEFGLMTNKEIQIKCAEVIAVLDEVIDERDGK